MNGGDKFFIDTDVLLYSLDEINVRKGGLAREWLDTLWDAGNGRLSWQVLHEFQANAVRKLKAPVSVAREMVVSYADWSKVDSSLHLIRRSWHWMDQAQISYWDGLIVAAAEQMGCKWLLTEDMQVGRKFGEVTIVNPFATAPPDMSV